MNYPYLEKVGRKSHRKLIIGITLPLVLLAILAVLFIALSIRKADSMMKHRKVESSPFAVNILDNFNYVNFTSLDGQTNLYGCLATSGEDSRGCVIFVHDNSQSRFPFSLDSKNLIDTFLKKNLDVLLFDLRHAGKSDGEYSSYGYRESEDLIAALNFIVANYPEKKVILYGIGTGCNAISYALSDLSHSSYQFENTIVSGQQLLQNIKGMVLDTPTKDSSVWINAEIASKGGFMSFLYPLSVPYIIKSSSGMSSINESQSALAHMPIPALFLGYETDSYLPKSAYEPLWRERQKSHAKLTTFALSKGVGHLNSYLNDRDAYLKNISDFIDQWF